MTTVAARYLALLAERGIDALYLNAGTDFAPLVEAYAEHKAASGFGVRVSEKADLRPALIEAIDAVRNEGRQALVNVECV